MLAKLVLKVQQLLGNEPNKVFQTRVKVPVPGNHVIINAGHLALTCNQGNVITEDWTMYHPPACHYGLNSSERMICSILSKWVEDNYTDVHPKLRGEEPQRLFISWEKVAIKPDNGNLDGNRTVEIYKMKIEARAFEGGYLGIG